MAMVTDKAAAQARLEELARAQGVRPIEDPAALVGDFWPEDESVDALIAAVRAWRHGEEPPPQ